MNKFIIVSIFIFISAIGQSQTKESAVYSGKFLQGAWYDSTENRTGGMVEVSNFEFEFSYDSCCNIIYNGKRLECHNNTTEIYYKFDFTANPKQIDIKVFDVKTNTLKSALYLIFEIIDDGHIKIAMSKKHFNDRPANFNPNEDIDIKILTKRKQ